MRNTGSSGSWCHGTRKMRILCPIENKVSQVISDIKERTDAQKSARSVCRQQLFLSGFLLVFRCICREMGFIFIQHSADHSFINEDWFRCSRRREDQFGPGIGFSFRNSRTHTMGAVWKRMSRSFVVHDPGEGDTHADNRNKYHSLIEEQWKEQWKNQEIL